MAMSEQERNQFLQAMVQIMAPMFVQGVAGPLTHSLIQGVLPAYQDMARQVVNHGVRAAQQQMVNFWNIPVAVERRKDDNLDDYELVEMTPAQIMAEACDELVLMNAQIGDFLKKRRRR